MTTKKIASANLKIRLAVRQPSAHHRLDTLLHTMRCIAQYEDALCELSYEVRRAGDFSPKISDELRDILEKIPSDDYVMDLDALRAAVAEPESLKPSNLKKAAESVPGRKISAIARKKSGRKSSR